MTKRNTKQTRDSRQERGAGLEPKSSGLEPKGSRQGPHPQGDAPIDEALKRSAACVVPDPGFVDRLGTRLARAHQTRRAPARTVSPRRPWWVWAGGAVAVLVMAVALAVGLNPELPATPMAPAPVPAATEPVTAESAPAEAPP